MTPAMRASRVLGWVSFAIGAAELIAPAKVAKATGMSEDRTGLLRAYGVRELLAGVGSHSVYPVPALWSRVVGDVVDIATVAMMADKDDQGRRSAANWATIAVLAGVTVVDAVVALRMLDETKQGKGEVRDYSDRTGFPKGAAGARGAGIVKDAFAGKAGGAAAGDSSPAGQSETGRSTTDLNGAPAETSAASGGVGNGQTVLGKPSSGSGSSAPGTSGAAGSPGSGNSAPAVGSLIGVGGGQTMSAEAQKAVPEPPSYTPA